MGATMTELLPCPFCGGGAHLYAAPGPIDHQVECIRCHAKVKIYMNEQDAIKAWNTRAERTCKNLLDNLPDSFKCSECGGVLDGVVFDPSEGAYCTYCGAKVVE